MAFLGSAWARYAADFDPLQTFKAVAIESAFASEIGTKCFPGIPRHDCFLEFRCYEVSEVFKRV